MASGNLESGGVSRVIAKQITLQMVLKVEMCCPKMTSKEATSYFDGISNTLQGKCMFRSGKLLGEPQMFCPRSFLNNDGESLTNNINKTIHGPINILYTWCNTSQVGRGFVCGFRGPYHGFEENFGRTTVS